MHNKYMTDKNFDRTYDPLATPIGVYAGMTDDQLPSMDFLQGTGFPDTFDREIGAKVLSYLDTENE